jgi:hypothetical protein
VARTSAATRNSQPVAAFTLSTLQTLIDAVEVCVSAGIFRNDAGDLSIELWALGHGIASLWAAGLIDADRARAMYEHVMQNTQRGLLAEAAAFQTTRA